MHAQVVDVPVPQEMNESVEPVSRDSAACGDDEADGNLNNAHPESCTSRSGAGLRFGETNTSKKSCGC